MRHTRLTAAVLGASGYAGGELLRLLTGHPRVDVTVVTADKAAGRPVTAVFPSLDTFHTLRFEPLRIERIINNVDLVFAALPHTASMAPVAACVRAGTPVIDLSADYRLTRAATYHHWYGARHTSPALLKHAVYGLPELHRARLRRARLVAVAGCYPTAAILQLAPLLARRAIVTDGIVIDAKSGVSGAGRAPATASHFPEANDSITAYAIARHRHIPEIEQELRRLDTPRAGRRGGGAVNVVFTPHLAPMTRGILSTACARLRTPLTDAAVKKLYREFYRHERFVRIRDDAAAVSPGHVRGSNFCDIGACVDRRTNHVVAVSALDNLVKGAAGQAIQCMNVMMGFPEETALTSPGVFP